ncbi:MAG: hypothetical protein KDK70_43115, partial [Myxococcales bacterium]|nr:hypothetical protein [Myxococcales bacterium]
MGMEQPASKTALSALKLLAQHSGILCRVSGHRWRLDAGADNGPVTKPDTEDEWQDVPKPDTTSTSNRTPITAQPSASWGSEQGAIVELTTPRARAGTALDSMRSAGVEPEAPPWTDNPMAIAFADRLTARGDPPAASVAWVSLTIADGVDLDAVIRAFREHYTAAHEGIWLVPELSQLGRWHCHGLIVSSECCAIIPNWQRCGGGIERAQWVQLLRDGDYGGL